MFTNKKLKEQYNYLVSDHNELVLLTETFAKITGVSLSKWLTDFYEIEHQYHSRLNEVIVREKELEIREKNLSFKIETEKEMVRAQCEKEYYHCLHTKLEEYAKQHNDFVNLLMKKVPEINLKDFNLNLPCPKTSKK